MTDVYYDQRQPSLKPNDFPKGKRSCFMRRPIRDFAMDGLVLPFQRQLQAELNGDYILLVKLPSYGQAFSEGGNRR
ncbi:hypothetical protein ACEQPO_26595 [Bacillus sp. SL00103]